MSYRLLASCLLIIGCRAEPSARTAVVRESLPDGHIVVYNPEAGQWTRETAWRLERDVIFSDSSGAPVDLSGRTAFTVDERGFAHVLLRRQDRVLTFDTQGRLVRSFGRTGAGPGEFRSPSTLAVGPDNTLWVVDETNGRYVVFDTGGRYLFDQRRALPRNCRPVPCTRFDAQGRLLDGSYLNDAPSVFRNRIYRLEANGQITDSTVLPTIDSIASPHFQPIVPYSPRDIYAVGQTGHIWFGTNDSYRLNAVRIGGETLLVAVKPARPLPIGREELREAERAANGFEQFAGIPQREVRAVHAQKPAFGQIAIDPEGRVWVVPATTVDGVSRAIDVFDPAGEFLGTASADFDISTASLAGPWDDIPPLEVSRNYIYALTPGGDGEAHMVRARIVRPAGER